MKIKIFFILILSFIFCPISFAENQVLEMEKNKLYILPFDEQIEDVLNNKKVLDVQILHTIFEDNRQIILFLTGDEDSVLQVKTNKNLYNYDVKKSNKSSEELIEIDIPPIENLQVDILDKRS